MRASIHSETVLATRLQARRQVIGLGRLQPLGAKEIQLLPNTLIHASKIARSQHPCPTPSIPRAELGQLA